MKTYQPADTSSVSAICGNNFLMHAVILSDTLGYERYSISIVKEEGSLYRRRVMYEP
jgi:hypothetical protein